MLYLSNAPLNIMTFVNMWNLRQFRKNCLNGHVLTLTRVFSFLTDRPWSLRHILYNLLFIFFPGAKIRMWHWKKKSKLVYRIVGTFSALTANSYRILSWNIGVIMKKIRAFIWHKKYYIPVEPWGGMRMQWEHTTLIKV